MSNKMQSFSVQIPVNDSKAMDEFQKIMDKIHDETVDHIQKLADKLGVSWEWASDIWYLRTRSRWTQELEGKLIQMAKSNQPHVNICDWPPDEE